MALSLDELLTAVTDFIGDDKEKAKEIAKALSRAEPAKPLIELIKRKGFNDASAVATRAQSRVTELEGQVALLTEQMEEKDAALEQLKSAAPDWKRRLDESESAYRKRVEGLTAELQQEKQARRDEILNAARQRFLANLQPGVEVEEDYATEVMLSKYGKHITLDEENKLVVIEPGEGTPYDKAGGDPLMKLAKDALGEVPSKYKLVPSGAAGAGTSTERQAPQRARTDTEIRAEGKKRGIYAF